MVAGEVALWGRVKNGGGNAEEQSDLAEDSEVTIRIYSAAGQLVRVLDLGHKKAGSYVTRNAAAHWDGRNEAGEQLASDVYFYTIQADDFVATKKMIVLR